MSINYQTLFYFKNLNKKVKNKNVLILGAQNLNEKNFSKKQCKKLQLEYSKIKKLFIKKNDSRNLKEKYINNKKILIYIFKSFGYKTVKDLDFNGLADYQIDMSKKIFIKKKFGLIWDGVSEYAFDFIRSRLNSINLLDNGGFLFFYFDHTSFNRYPVNLSPEYIVDFYIENGMICDSIDIVNYQNKFLKQYRLNFIDKGNTFFQNLGLLSFLKYLFSTICQNFLYPNSKYKIDPKKYHLIKKNKFKNLKNYRFQQNIFQLIINQAISILKVNYIGRYNFRYLFHKKSNKKNKKFISSTLHYSIFNQQS